MKKLFAVSILFIFLSAAAFAQFKVGVSAEFQGDILRTNAYMDDSKDDTKSTHVSDKGYVHFLSTYDFWNDSSLRFALSYTDSSDKDDPKYGALLELKADFAWVNYYLTGLAGADVGKLTTGTATGVGAGSLAAITFMTPIGDWEVWGKAGILKGFIGNTADRGATTDGRFAHYNDYMDKFKFEQLGIMKPVTSLVLMFAGPPPVTANIPVTPAKQNTYPFAPKDADVANLQWGDNAYVSVKADLKPITIAVAGELKGAVDQAQNADHSSTGAAFRVSGDLPDIMGLKFDVIYKVFGNTGSGGDGDIDDAGQWQNRFGLFANLGLMDNTLGITVGYSGDFIMEASNQKPVMPATNPPTTFTVDYVHPYYSGIDLRAQYTGVTNLTVSLNNNLSFSSIKGRSEQDLGKNNTVVNGIIQNNLSTTNTSTISEGYFGMYNALLADLKLDDLLLSFQIGNRWYSYTNTTKIPGFNDVKGTWDVDVLQIVAAASYTLGDHVTFGTGLAFNVFHSTSNRGGPNDPDVKNGVLTFGIPLTVKVVF